MSLVIEDDPRVPRAAAAVLAVERAEAGAKAGPAEVIGPLLPAAEARGYFLPDEDAAVRVRYTQYLAGRAALLQALESMEAVAGPPGPARGGRLPAFAVALLAACLLVRGTREWIALASRSRLLRRKLDEADRVHGLPRKTFARLYRATTDPRRMWQLREALAFYREKRSEFAPLAEGVPFGEVLEALDRETAARSDGTGYWRDWLGYRWFSFRRRHRSAWQTTVFGLFRGSGSLIAELRQPLWKGKAACGRANACGGAKRVTPQLGAIAVAQAKAGDVFVTRHDDALSNLFLPGFWPHAALCIGDSEERRALGIDPGSAPWRSVPEGARFLEARKDGVRFRAAADTLAVDSLVILRPPLDGPARREALERAASHAGKPYDFVFDFRTSDRLACTEVIYRSYHGCGPLAFSLSETGGRLCLPAEELITQALAQGFRVVGAAGIGRGGWLRGLAAETALHTTRCGL